MGEKIHSRSDANRELQTAIRTCGGARELLCGKFGFPRSPSDEQGSPTRGRVQHERERTVRAVWTRRSAGNRKKEVRHYCTTRSRVTSRSAPLSAARDFPELGVSRRRCTSSRSFGPAAAWGRKARLREACKRVFPQRARVARSATPKSQQPRGVEQRPSFCSGSHELPILGAALSCVRRECILPRLQLREVLGFRAVPPCVWRAESSGDRRRGVVLLLRRKGHANRACGERRAWTSNIAWSRSFFK
mmetsp:Transcript_4868/g.12023  ORF Transcript_4868/g.12023 Transcript_4868/m.12023 type:complete len:247 (+) Transcript_4868:5498-6238(+)